MTSTQLSSTRRAVTRSGPTTVFRSTSMHTHTKQSCAMLGRRPDATHIQASTSPTAFMRARAVTALATIYDPPCQHTLTLCNRSNRHNRHCCHHHPCNSRTSRTYCRPRPAHSNSHNCNWSRSRTGNWLRNPAAWAESGQHMDCSCLQEKWVKAVLMRRFVGWVGGEGIHV